MSFEIRALPPLFPIDFFRAACDVAYAKNLSSLGKKHLLPDTSSLLAEEGFAECKIGWNEEALLFIFEVKQPYAQSVFPEYEEGDALELFIDTRAMRSAFMTRFCHHFLLFPQEKEGVHSQEVTRFRTEDVHPLCPPDSIEVLTECGKRKYMMHIEIPAHILHGFDPLAFPRLGFTYRLHRFHGTPQHFAVSSVYSPIDRQVQKWGMMHLKR